MNAFTHNWHQRAHWGHIIHVDLEGSLAGNIYFCCNVAGLEKNRIYWIIWDCSNKYDDCVSPFPEISHNNDLSKGVYRLHSGFALSDPLVAVAVLDVVQFARMARIQTSRNALAKIFFIILAIMSLFINFIECDSCRYGKTLKLSIVPTWLEILNL